MTETKGPSILIVDDNPYHRKLIHKLLESAGYSVMATSSGKEALAVVEKTRFELMILDLSMPDMDGFDVLPAVRSKQPELKVLAVSGFMHGRMLESAKLLGAVATLNKDLVTDLLLPKVGNFPGNPK